MLAFVACLGARAFSQGPPPPNPPNEDMVDAYRVAFMTRFLELTPGEAEKFWPVYNQMRDEIKAVTDKQTAMMQNKKIEDMNDAELNNFIAMQLQTEQDILDIRKKYAEEFKKVLPLQKVAKLSIAEEEFKRKLVDILRNKQGPPPGQGGKGPDH